MSLEVDQHHILCADTGKADHLHPGVIVAGVADKATAPTAEIITGKRAVRHLIMAVKIHSPIEKKGFIAESAQKFPFIRLMYKKWNESAINKKSQSTVSDSENQLQNDENDINDYVDKMNAILGEIYAISEEKGIEPVILLHERFWEDRDGNITTEMNASYKETFIKCCEDNGVKVIDVAPEIIKAYNESFEYSYGFANSTPGEGHLNKTGHRIIAQTIYNKINEMENAK